MKIFHLIDQLVEYGVQKHLIQDEDCIYVRNQLLEKFKLQHYEPTTGILGKKINHIEILDQMVKYAYEKQLIQSINPPFSDLFDTSLMALLVPRPSEVRRTFDKKYQENPEKATDYFYDLSKNSHYIRMDRIKKNIVWNVDSEYGKINITVNLSKPEKDPKAIAMAKGRQETGYPKCLLCYENVGYQGHVNHPARQSHRVVPLTLNGEAWCLQYSPYVYFNEHSIVFKKQHDPMTISEKTFIRLIDFVDYLPHYFIGSNADLPIVGGSMLSHDHYQSGRFEFPMEKATLDVEYDLFNNDSCRVHSLHWPLTVLRINSENREAIIELATQLTAFWRGYSDEQAGVLSETDGVAHNTVTPIVRKKDTGYEIDIVLRNNRTSETYPDGIFHPHADVHPVKKENIGLIEVMGLAVLPSRLKDEMKRLEEAVIMGKTIEEVKEDSRIEKFSMLYSDLLKRKETSTKPISNLVKESVGLAFVTGLEHAGVFKKNDIGKKAMERFMNAFNQRKES